MNNNKCDANRSYLNPHITVLDLSCGEQDMNVRSLINHSHSTQLAASRLAKSQRSAWLWLMQIMLLAVAWVSLPAGASTIKNLQFSSLPGGQVEIVLSLDGAPPPPTAYTIEKPANIALDLAGVKNGLSAKYHNLGVGNARSITLMETKDRTRVIINLTELVPYTSKTVGNDLVITVGRDATQKIIEQSSETKGADLAGVTDKRMKKTTSGIEQIDFRRGADADGQVIITLSDPSASVDMREQGGKILVEFSGVNLPESLRRRLDVIDFATPVKSVDATMEENNALIQINPTGRYEYLAYQADKTFTISVKPVTEEEQNKRNKDNFMYTGEKLSLNFQDIEVRNVLQLIADFTGLNLVASDTVSGNITLRLQNVPWDQALDLILKTKGLDKRKVGNVMLVAPADEIAAREKLELETSKQVQELAPIRSEFIQVNYAKAKNLAGLITGSANGGMLSPRGSVIVDERTNTILLNDTTGKIDEVRRMLVKLDVPVKQVLIESRVVVANKNFDKELGIRWGGNGHRSSDIVLGIDPADPLGDPKAYRDLGGKVAGGSLTTIGNEAEAVDATKSFTTTVPDDLVVDLGVNNSQATSVALGFLSDKYGLLQMELSALESDGKADIIATPKVLTADQQMARIASGTEIPYQEASSSGATSVSFKEAVLSLEVTPQITPDGRIIMALKVNQDTVGEIFNNVPSIDTNEIQTSVLVEDGETVVLGGVFRTQTVDSIVKTPFFGDLPILGRLFKKTIRSDEKQELLVFITPKIVKNVMAQQ